MKSFNITEYNSIKCVDSRSLFIALKYKPEHYPRWVKNFHNLGEEGIDFFKHKSMLFDAPEIMLRKRYHISLIFACELCAFSRTEHGRKLKYEFRRILGINVKK